jgi:hypothetical protein
VAAYTLNTTQPDTQLPVVDLGSTVNQASFNVSYFSKNQSVFRLHQSPFR